MPSQNEIDTELMRTVTAMRGEKDVKKRADLHRAALALLAAVPDEGLGSSELQRPWDGAGKNTDWANSSTSKGLEGEPLTKMNAAMGIAPRARPPAQFERTGDGGLITRHASRGR